MKIDLHLHSNVSSDSVLRIEDAFKIANKKGLQGIALTDHNTDASWMAAKKIAKELKMEFIPGEEVMVRKNGRRFLEIIGLFMNERINAKEDEMEVIDELKQQDAIAVIAHPFDPLRTECKEIEKLSAKIDGVEVFNSRCVLKRFNENALKFAIKYGLARAGGSDAHMNYEVGNAFTEADCTSLEEFRKALKGRRTTARGIKSIPLVHAVSILKKRTIRFLNQK